jgi:serine/threonine-protein kinase
MNIGDRVGDYEIVAVLGRGGMGQVYKVRNILSERIEAMKVLLPTLEGDKDLGDRFLREIKVQAALDHPNIAKLYNAFRATNQLLMVMEFVDGASLEQLMLNGPLMVADATRYAGQVLNALSYAHGHGVVHRDIKPANIMRTPEGAIKLLDFGLARVRTDQALTQPGTTVGSLSYMSPEQIRGTEPDPRSDLYSLGIVLYEMLTGKRPFQGDSNYAIMAAHLKEIPAPPDKVVPWIAAPLSEIIMKAIAKDPADRFQSAEDFRSALREMYSPAVNQAVTQPLQTLPLSPPPAATTNVPTGATVAAAATMNASAPEKSAAPTQLKATPLPIETAAVAPQIPPPVPVPAQQSSGSRRGLYMALGSIATLAALALAAVEVPKFLHARANETNKPAVSEPSPASSTPTPPPPSAVSPSTNEQGASAASNAPPSSTLTPTVNQPVPVTRGTSAQAQSLKAATTQPAQNAQVSNAADASNAEEIARLSEEHSTLNASATAAKESLGSIKNQMAAQGLGLRRDIVEAESQMNLHLNLAKKAIRAGDSEGAKRHMEMAQYALNTIDKFLGH